MENTEVNNNDQKIPDDYYSGEWIKVVNKKKMKREERLKRREKEAKENYLRKLKEKKIEERKNAKLWYDEESWQQKILNEQIVYEDGQSLTEKYEISELIEMFKNAKNNYRKNGIFYKLMKVITKEEWENIKDKVKYN